MTALDDVISRLEGVKRSGKGFVAKCPAHEDHRQSLGISEGDDGRVLLKCYAGCETVAVCGAVGLTLNDLFADRGNGSGGNGHREIVATYDYTDENGDLLYQVVRFEPKDFRQRRWVNGAWEWKLGDVERVLYHLNEIGTAIRGGSDVWITEGEKDADALRKAGQAATSAAGGAGAWRDHYAESLIGAKVVVVADRDEPGYKHAARVARSLEGKAASVRIVGAAVAKDAYDHLTAGKTVEEFVEADLPGEAPPEPVQVFYSALDLRDYVSPHIDWVIEKLLAKGVLTIFGGKPKAGKTTFAFGAVHAMRSGCPFMGLETRKARVLYITEQNKTTIRPKLAEYGLLDCPDVHVMFPRQMLGMAWEDIIDQAATYCEAHSIDVVIVDTVNDLCHLKDTFSDTEWIGALDPLQRLAERGGRAVMANLHAKKEPASLVDMFRGSNAIVGKADIVLGLWRDGSGDETSRTVEGMSRLDNGFDERTRIVRQGREYMTSGTVKEMELEAKLAEYLDVLPTSREAAITRQEIAAALDVAPGTVSTYVKKLMDAGKVLCETRPGRGSARLYWAAGG